MKKSPWALFLGLFTTGVALILFSITPREKELLTHEVHNANDRSPQSNSTPVLKSVADSQGQRHENFKNLSPVLERTQKLL